MEEDLLERFILARDRIFEIAEQDQEGLSDIQKAFVQESICLKNMLVCYEKGEKDHENSQNDQMEKEVHSVTKDENSVYLELLFHDLCAIPEMLLMKEYELSVALLELFIEIYCMEEDDDMHASSLHDAYYWMVSDYVKEIVGWTAAQREKSASKDASEKAGRVRPSFEQLAQDCITKETSDQKKREAFFEEIPFKNYVLYFDKRLMEQMMTAARNLNQKK